MNKFCMYRAFCLLWLTSIVVSGAKPADPAFGELLCRKNSLYTAIYVYQRDSIVTLRFGMRDSSTIQSQVDLDNPRRHMLEYTEMSFCGLLFNPDPNAVLVLGQGGGVIPRDVHHYFPNAMIDVVEIDGEISAVAEKYFDFRTDEKLRVRVDDGRMFIKKKLLREPGQKYDWVILDAFNGDYIPFHLMTKEFLQEVKSILTDDGVVVANVFLSNRLFDSELKTFRSVFGQCQVFAGIRSGNAMLAATAAQGPALTIEAAVKRAGQLQDRHGFEFDMVQIARRLDPGFVEDSEAMLLTDDRAPVNWLKTQQIR